MTLLEFNDGSVLVEARGVRPAAGALLTRGSGGVRHTNGKRSLEMTVLLTVDGAVEALRTAERVQYRAPNA